jgi:hypothetical protein
MFFQLAAFRPGRLLAQACATGSEVIGILCTTRLTITRPHRSAIPRPSLLTCSLACDHVHGFCGYELGFVVVPHNEINSVDDGTRHPVWAPDTAGERVVLRVTVSQRTTGAVAEGETLFKANGNEQQWAVHARTFGRQRFEPGPATATALALTLARGGEVTDSHQWLVEVTLEEE